VCQFLEALGLVVHRFIRSKRDFVEKGVERLMGSCSRQPLTSLSLFENIIFVDLEAFLHDTEGFHLGNNQAHTENAAEDYR